MIFLLFNLRSHISQAIMALEFLHVNDHLTLGAWHFQFGTVYCKMFDGLFPLENFVTSLHRAFNFNVLAVILKMNNQLLIAH